MALHLTTVHAVLWTILYSFTENVRASPCAEVNSSSMVVPFGSAVTASCYIKEECPLTINQDFFTKWKKNGHFIPSSKGTQKNVYEILIYNFTDVRAVLECFICSHDICNVVGAVEIRTVYPPSIPKNLTCLLNLNEPATLMCTWDPGKKTSDIPTNYTLYTEIRDTSPLQKFAFVPSPEENFYRVPRVGFALLHEVQVYVVARNALGQATSNLLVLDPMKTAKLDPPVIQGVGTQTFGCLEYKWSLSHTQKWIRKTLPIEIKFTPVNNNIFNKEQSIQQFSRRPDNKVKVCGLLHGMSYESQMRVKYQNSSPWSEWSNATVATTPMKAPTGRLVTWLKLLKPEGKKQTAQLFWKPSLQFRANSMNVSYTVSLMGELTKKKETVCVTDQQHCSFQIHAKVRKVCLTAMNEAGKSNPTEVPVYRQRGMDPVPFLKIVPQSEESLLAKWKRPDTSTISAYVLEWKSLCGTNPNHVSFEILDRNQTSFVASGLEPYIPYEISVYPKYGGGIGRPYSIVAYTKQKAPSISPKLEIGKITPSFVELFWDEIPLKQRNGIITGYRIFYRDEKNNTGVIDIENTTRHVVLKDLYPFTIYELFLMTSTDGGSVTGSSVTVKTASIDAFEIVLIVIPACVGLTLLFFGVFTCFIKQKWMKKYVWPVIPDPANSNIKKWTTADSLECMPPFKEVKDPVLVYLSHLSLLSLPEKELSKGDENIKNGNWPYKGKSVDTGHDDSSHDSETFDSEQQSESVPYATVVFAGPYRRQPVPPPVYLRSESTQPLLGEEEPSSPRPYEKMTNQDNLSDVDHFSTFHKNLSAGKEKTSLWVDFPMLRSLEINSKS
ncbi:granulocyte colony-stimulating factor receptor isoform X2 [Pangasianodon hypophthalmus]|nr:granulocyte colony-stimulating factor receptor isoform X2 [Pangasianodon hypophthalmus]XP_053093138.1 granulocyte colony-stimulating factor receptor isoform X2 [Pangasianodon hypophthalmus]